MPTLERIERHRKLIDLTKENIDWLRETGFSLGAGATVEEASNEVLVERQKENLRMYERFMASELDAALDQWMEFSVWNALFNGLSPYQVAGLADAALDDPPRLARVQVHFWNAVIDHLLTAAFLAPEMDYEVRVRTVKMAGMHQDIVRDMLASKPDVLKMCEEAWDVTVQQASSQQDFRDKLFAAGAINLWGRARP